MNQEKKIDISFIIPVYNGAGVIERMLQSIERMPSEISFEVIAVDDGSTDNTADVLGKAASADERIRVLSQKNAGQSAARNKGLSAAEGRYVFFADADDAVIAEGIAGLFRIAESGDYDMICGTYRRLEPGKEPYRACAGLPSGILSREGEGEELFGKLKTESAFGYLWNKLFKKSFLDENGLCFDASIRVYMEDQLFNLKAFGCGAKGYFLNEPVYDYYFEGESTTRKADPEIAKKSVEMLGSYDAFLKEKGIREENQDLFVPLAMRMACWAAFKNIAYEGADFKKIRERLDVFADAEPLQYMFGRKESLRIIGTVPSFLQRRLFGLSFRLLARKNTGRLAALFAVGSPLLKAAAKTMVR